MTRPLIGRGSFTALLSIPVAPHVLRLPRHPPLHSLRTRAPSLFLVSSGSGLHTWGCVFPPGVSATALSWVARQHMTAPGLTLHRLLYCEVALRGCELPGACQSWCSHLACCSFLCLFVGFLLVVRTSMTLMKLLSDDPQQLILGPLQRPYLFASKFWTRHAFVLCVPRLLCSPFIIVFWCQSVGTSSSACNENRLARGHY